MKTSVDPGGLAAPVGPYALVTHAPGGGRLVFCAGAIATDATGRVVGKGDIARQTEQVMDNLGVALAAAGATFDDVMKITTYVTDATLYAQLAPVRARYLTEPFPASTLIEVKGLMWPELLVEIDAIAIVAD
jgi:enamine deaminase RidA (YjgF/YER057c/UK114 family)